MLKKLLPVMLFLLLLTAPCSSYEKCEKFDQELCEYVKGQTSGKEVRVIVYATENISSQLNKISEVEIIDTHGGKHLFQISISDNKLEELGEIPEVTYVKMPNEPVTEGENNGKENESINKKQETKTKLDTYLIASLVTLALIISFIIAWRLRK